MHTVITEEKFRESLDDVAGRAFVFFGEEDYLKAAAVRSVREGLCPDPVMAFFNDITIDATDYTPDKLLDVMSPPPMMTDARLIVLRGFDLNGMKAAEIDSLVEVLAQLSQYDFNCIILYVAAGLFDTGRLPRSPSSLFKKIASVATPVSFATPNDARLARWVGRHFAHHGVRATPAACNELIVYAGKAMFVLANEVEKLAAYVKQQGRAEVSVGDVQSVAAPVALTNAFALSNAILAGDGAAALDTLAVMRFERVKPEVVLGEISQTLFDMLSLRVLFDAGRSIGEISAALNNMHEYKVKLYQKALSRIPTARLSRVIALAAEADLALKTSSSSDYAPIEKLICAL